MSDAVAKENSAIELVKSIAVIPLVVALVLGIAWGLVRWAAMRQAASGKDDPRSAEKGVDGSLVLQIPFAQVTGEIHYGGGAEPALGNWKRTDETVTWRFNVEKPGRYAVELNCACDSANAGSVVRIELDSTSQTGARLEATIPDTGSQDTFKMVPAGIVELTSAGWRNLHIVPISIPHNAVMTLRGVRLAPVTTSS